MAYCRPGVDSDVYMYLGGSYEFHYVKPDAAGNCGFSTADPRKALAHFFGLREAGLKVPQPAIDRLVAEIERAGLPSPKDGTCPYCEANNWTLDCGVCICTRCGQAS